VVLEGVAGLRVDVDADDLEAGPVIADGGATGAGVQVEEPRRSHHPSLVDRR
jgi:hypothetical protein